MNLMFSTTPGENKSPHPTKLYRWTMRVKQRPLAKQDYRLSRVIRQYHPRIRTAKGRFCAITTVKLLHCVMKSFVS